MKKRFFKIIIVVLLCIASLAMLVGCDSIIKAIFGSGGTQNGGSDGENNPPAVSHEHEMTHKSFNQSTCTGSGNVEYWYCKSCGKYFADENGKEEITDVTQSTTGHLYVWLNDESGHWQSCKYCQNAGEKQSHSAEKWSWNKNVHFKSCEICDYQFEQNDHVLNGSDCGVCGYFTDYANKCNSDYGYNYFASLSNGSKLQAFYNDIDAVASEFHGNANANASVKISKTESGATVTNYALDSVSYVKRNLTVDEAKGVWAVYRYDHPLYYWLSGNLLFTSSSISMCSFEDYANGAERTKQNAKLYLQINEYLNIVSGETSAYQKAFAFHDAIIKNVEYAKNADGSPSRESWAHSVIGVFERNSAVCEGYAKSFQLLLNASNVENVYVTGRSKGEGHAWNLAEIDGNWYWYDLTWDDQPSFPRGIAYNYLCKSGKTFADHNETQANDWSDAMNYLYALPQASSAEYNSDGLEYGDEFTVDDVTYAVCGYGCVTLKSSALQGVADINNTVEFNGRKYKVTEIGQDAFRNCDITELVIPSNVEVINNFALYGCGKLNAVRFADVERWTRYPQNGKTAQFESISADDLRIEVKAARLLKEYYVGNPLSSLITQYVWVKQSIAAN